MNQNGRASLRIEPDTTISLWEGERTDDGLALGDVAARLARLPGLVQPEWRQDCRILHPKPDLPHGLISCMISPGTVPKPGGRGGPGGGKMNNINRNRWKLPGCRACLCGQTVMRRNCGRFGVEITGFCDHIFHIRRFRRSYSSWLTEIG